MKKTRFLCSAQKTMISCSLFTTTYYKVQISAVSEPWRNHVCLCTAQKSLISHAQYSVFFYFTGEVGCELLCAINKSFQQESLVDKCCTMWSFKKSHVSAHQQKISTALCTAKQNASKEPHFFFISVYGRMWEWYIWNWWVWGSWKAFNFSLGFSFKMSSLAHWITEMV